MLELIKLKAPTNKNAISVLEKAITRIKKGEITQVAIACVTSDNGIDGSISDGNNNILMWAALEHCAKDFYDKQIK